MMKGERGEDDTLHHVVKEGLSETMSLKGDLDDTRNLPHEHLGDEYSRPVDSMDKLLN